MAKKTLMYILAITVLLSLSIIVYAENRVEYQGIVFSTDKPTYLPGETVTVSITFPTSFTGSIYLYVYDPLGSLVLFRYATLTNQTFYMEQYTPDPNVLGVYTVKANVQGRMDNQTINVPATIFSITFEVKTQYAVRGQVVDENGFGVAGVTVQAIGTGATAITDSNGFFTLNLPQPGTYTLSATKENYLPGSTTVTVQQLGVTELAQPIVIRSVVSVVIELESRVKAIEENLIALNNVVSSLNATLTALSDRVGSLEDSTASLASQLETLTQQVESSIGELRNELEAIRKDLSSLSAELREKYATKEYVDTKYGDLSADINTKFTELSTKIANLESRLNEEVSKINTDISSIRNDLDLLKEATITQLSGQISDLAGRLGELTDSLNELQKTQGELANSIAATSRTAMIAVILAIVGIIIAIIAVIMVYRKIA